MFQPTVPLLEVVARVVVVYAGLFALLRLGGKREIGQLAPMDFLAMLLLSETVSPALTGGDHSVSVGLVAAAALVGLTLLVDWATYRSKALARFVEGRPHVLVEDGRVDAEVQRAEKLTDEDLLSALRAEGVESLEKVRLAVVETNGRVSVIRRDET